MSATVQDVMTAEVAAARPDTSFKDMVSMLGNSRVSALPVVDAAGRVIGVVSEADLLLKEAGQASFPGLFAGLRRRRDHDKAAGTTAADLMTSPPVLARPDDTVQHAALLMYDRGVKRLPVVDADGRLAGIVSRADVLSVFGRADEEIRAEVIDQVLRHRCQIDPVLFGVSVRDGIVTVAGSPETAEAGRNILEAIRLLDGVVAVRDRLVYPGGHRHQAAAGTR